MESWNGREGRQSGLEEDEKRGERELKPSWSIRATRSVEAWHRSLEAMADWKWQEE